MSYNYKRNSSSGYTLIEILVVILFLALFSGFMISSYLSTIREGKSGYISSEKERELLALQNYLRKLIGSIGFGIDVDKLKVVNVSCTDNNLNNFKSANGALGLAENCSITNGPTHDRLYFRSLYATGAEKAGCWWAIDIKGNYKTMGIDKFGKPCEIEGGDQCVFLDLSKKLLGTNFCNSSICNCTRLAFYYNSTSPEVFRIHLTEIEANDTSQRQRCAPKSGILMLQREGNINSEPLFDCVGGLKFQLIYLQNATQNATLIQAIRMCLLIQVSGRMTTPREVPNNSTCGNFTQLPDASWRYYRWRVIEEIIPLENLR